MLKLTMVASVLSSLLAFQACSAKEPDYRNSTIEVPLKREVSLNSAVIPEALAVPDNRKVMPGKVVWHQSFEAARAASKVSGKPVLLFQMMGKLDDQFC
jgi:hypothetical protein